MPFTPCCSAIVRQSQIVCSGPPKIPLPGKVVCTHTRPRLVSRQTKQNIKSRGRIVCANASTKQLQQDTDVSPPHSGYHYAGAKRRFFEGWYFKVSCKSTFQIQGFKRSENLHSISELQVTLPGDGQSFAWMYSIEDPAGDGKFSGCGAQVRLSALQ